MGQLVLDEVALREPRLLVPGMQPVGRVQINRDHPLGKGLMFYVLPSMGGANIIDLVSGLVAVPSGAITKKAVREGVVISNVNTNNTGYYTFSVPPKIFCGGGYSIAHRYSSYGNSYSGGLLKGTGNSNFMPYRSSNYWLVSPDDAFGNGATPNLHSDTNTWHSYVVAQNGKLNSDTSGAVNAYKDGIQHSSCLRRLAATSTFTISLVGKADYSIDGMLAYVGFWSRELSASDVDELHRDPYQFLIPA